MSIESDMNVSTRPLNPLSYVISGPPSNPLYLVVWMSEAPSCSASQPMSSTQPMGMNPFAIPFGMKNNDSHSIPLASNPFYFGILDMMSHFSSFILMTNMIPIFWSRGTMPPYAPFLFGRGYIP
jgi:hypothetical protein